MPAAVDVRLDAFVEVITTDASSTVRLLQVHELRSRISRSGDNSVAVLQVPFHDPVALALLPGRMGRERSYRCQQKDTGRVHRSTSPNTMSSEPMMAETSASMWPRERKSIA